MFYIFIYFIYIFVYFVYFIHLLASQQVQHQVEQAAYPSYTWRQARVPADQEEGEGPEMWRLRKVNHRRASLAPSRVSPAEETRTPSEPRLWWLPLRGLRAHACDPRLPHRGTWPHGGTKKIQNIQNIQNIQKYTNMQNI